MASNETTKPTIYYTSCHKHALDAQRRVQLPAVWRPATPDEEFTMVLWPKHAAGKCLRVLPDKQLEKLMAELDALPNNDPDKVFLKRFIGSNSVRVALDGAGRICIPAEMKVEAGIGKEVMFVGMLDRFEIWSVERNKLRADLDAPRASVAFERME